MKKFKDAVAITKHPKGTATFLVRLCTEDGTQYQTMLSEPKPIAEMLTHTPGPWKTLKGSDDDPNRWAVVANRPRKYLIATIENGQPGDCLETEAATACAISAVPEMLAALKEVAHHADDECGFMVEVRAAIAKAEGR